MIPREYVEYGLYGAAALGLLVELPNIRLGSYYTNLSTNLTSNIAYREFYTNTAREGIVVLLKMQKIRWITA